MALLATDAVTLKYTSGGLLDVAAMCTAAAFDSGVTAVVTGVRQRMALIRGEWFLDQDAGVPWFERDGVDAAVAIFGAPFDEAVIRGALLAAVLDTPGVVEVTRLSIAYDGETRHVTVTWQARTSFGDTPIDSLKLGT